MLRQAVDDDEDFIEDDRPDWRTRLRNWVMRHPKDAVAVLVAITGAGTIVVNALYLQSGPHPAPLFSLRSLGVSRAVGEMPRPRPLEQPQGQTLQQQQNQSQLQQQSQQLRTRADLVADIQRGLAKRGLYDGAVDGIYGPKTDSAVRDFAQTAHLKVGPEPTEALLQSINTSAVKEIRPAPVASMSRGRHDAIADLIGPSSRVLAVQRVLSDYGYGQIKPTGVLGPDTAAAIEKFERARQLPVTGQVSDRLMRELAAVTGRPLE
jgi:peptidoglycan hydrolase-like protein with peptidoglycan-binding domain